jgi:hypothetical protein
MRDDCNLTDFSISTNSTDPLCGVVKLGTAGSSMTFHLTEEVAHRMCTDLERFLTQARQLEVRSRHRG